ncbi:hypothetical protein G7Z17_g6188 [Cylindrodendrum hubeiense]|uniref:Uncharacterized protein n=1 Tax=Cylindrodendrum hubeiense TaxID=595255 RepID=A0A9P5LGL1_9HYPO|nr:hypothetical protein G7Z17_g6188 [Cylindrodendrum hubeiense]
MPNKSRLDRVFARLLQNHPYGWALYKKATAEELHPGCCGYFDTDGDWHTLVDLMSSEEDLIRQGWDAPGNKLGNKDEEPETLIWSPKTSKSVVSCQIGGEAGASPVLRHRVGNESAAIQWMKDNTPEILTQYRPIVERHGIWVVTKTYTSHRCGVVVMASKSSKVEIGIGASAPGLFTLDPSSSWASSHGDLAAEIHEDERGVVAFISGIYFSKKLFSSKLKHLSDQDDQKKKIFRGGYVESDEGGSEDEEYGQNDESGQDETDEDEEEFEMQLYNCHGA